MTDFKLRGHCKFCKRNRWFIRKRAVRLPTGETATSKDLMCPECFKRLKQIS